MNGTRLSPVPHLRARTATWLLGLATTLAIASCGGSSPIRIGLLGTFGDPLGKPERFGAQMAAKEINAAGGINGHPIEFIEAEDLGDPDSAVTAAERLAKTDVVAVIGGSFSGPTLASAPVFNDPTDPVVQITPSGSNPDISNAGDWTFRVCPSDLSHAAALARFAHQTLHLDRAAVIYMNNGYGRGFRNAFEREFARLGGSIVSSDPYLPEKVNDAAPYIDRIAQEGQAQLILAASYETDGAVLLKMARAKKVMVPFMGGDGLEGIEREGPVAEGAYQTAAYLANNATLVNSAWVANYRAEFPSEPAPNQTAVATYDAVNLLAKIIADVGTDRRKIRDALAQVGTGRPAYDGVAGKIAFDSLGDVPEKQVLIAQAHNGVSRAVEGVQ